MSALLSRPVVWLLIALALVISMDGLGDRKLANPDEGRYSEISREMAASGDFVTPRLNGIKYFEKPPMQYWASAISFKLFGLSEWSARLYSMLCGLGCVLLAAYCARRCFDQDTALLTAAVLATAPYFAAMGEIVTLDMGLTLWMTLTVTSYLIAERASTAAARTRWLLAGWVGMAGAVLSKGLIGIVFPGAAIFLYCVLHRDFGRLARLAWLPGLAMFFALTVPWFYLVSQANPEFLRFFFIHEHFERFTSTAHRRTEAWWFFFPILFAGFLPWLVTLLPAIRRAWRRAPQMDFNGRAFSPLRFIVIYSAFILLFFSASGSKLPAYILPFFPVLAIVIAAYLKQCESTRLAWMVLPIVPLALAGAWAAMRAPERRGSDAFAKALFQSMSEWVTPAAVVVAACALIAYFLLRMDRKWLGILTMTLGTMIGIEMIERGYEKISPLQSAHALAQSIRSQGLDKARIYSVVHYEQGLPFYLNRFVTLVDYLDEFETGLKAEPQKSIPKLADLPAAWNAPGDAVAIIQPSRLNDFKALGLPFTIIHQDSRRLALKKTPPA
ncbi:MAG: glycosyltransferase family 39 protein [Betaproteobacteria bacterium]|nr:glycosyltransferase family 39 protein [Betaproteobacteria bacterium]